MAVILCDFDGTVIPMLPEGGTCWTKTGADVVLKKLVNNGHKIVLWTCRNSNPENPYNFTNGKLRKETSLDEAVGWFRKNSIPLYGINSLPDEYITKEYSRKVLGDYLIDDTSVGAPLIYKNIKYKPYGSDKCKIAKSHFIDWKKVNEYFKQINLY